ncbi:hypothetical protein BURK_001680 [Burkholderia sp. SJ98]|nr:hypothetical protein BURK_001680 [Burkholderia sp. SJ98]
MMDFDRQFISGVLKKLDDDASNLFRIVFGREFRDELPAINNALALQIDEATRATECLTDADDAVDVRGVSELLRDAPGSASDLVSASRSSTHSKSEILGPLSMFALAHDVSVRKFDEGDAEEGLRSLVLASQLLGQALERYRIFRSTQQTTKQGAAQRHTSMSLLRDWAVQLYLDGPGEGKSWPSANSAAHTLKKRIIDRGRLIGANLAESNAQRTIAEWFRKSV